MGEKEMTAEEKSEARKYLTAKRMEVRTLLAKIDVALRALDMDGRNILIEKPVVEKKIIVPFGRKN